MTAINREVIIGDCRLLLGDCRDILQDLGGVDAVVTDVPYGIGEAAGKNKSRVSLVKPRDYGNMLWDNKPISPEEISSILKLAPWQIIFGGNYYALPATRCWLIWDKVNGKSDFTDCEMAWTNLPKAVRLIHYMWNGIMRAHGKPRGDHPTQKPVGVMKWALSHLPEGVRTICDPYAGSGTTGVACVSLGFSFIGIEREPSYFDAMCRRIQKAYEQPDMLIEVKKDSQPSISKLL